MSNIEKINQQLATVKICSPAEVSKHFATIFELFSFLTNPEKKEVAMSFYEWAEAHANEEPRMFAFANYFLAGSDFFADEYELSLRHANESRIFFIDNNEPDESAVCSALIGSLFRTFGNLDLALKELWAAYHQLKKSNNYPHNTMICAFQIGSIYLEMKNHDEALPFFTYLLELAEAAQNDMMIVLALQGLGKIYLMQKQHIEAKETYEKGRMIAEKINSTMHIAVFDTELAFYYSEKGDYSRSEQLHKQALELREAHKYTGGAITNCIRLGDIYILQSRTDDAISILNKGMMMAEQLKVKPKIYEIHRLLSEIYEQKNDLKKSLYHYKQFHKIREEVEIEDNARKIKNMQLVFEAEQTMKENIIIKKQKEEIERKNIELQETIDELTLSKINRKAKALTLAIAISLFFVEELLLDFVLHKLPEDNFILSFGAKLLIVFSLKPIERGIEHHLVKKVIKKKKREVLV